MKAQQAKALADAKEAEVSKEESSSSATTSLTSDEEAALVADIRERKDNGLQPTPDILTIKRFKNALPMKEWAELVKPPLHGADWSRLGTGNFLSNRMTTKDHLGDEKLHSLHNYIPASKNLTSRSQVTMGTDKVLEISKSDISKTLRFTTKSQVVAAILRRMNAMLRNPVKSSPGFIEQRERGAFLEYCTYLHHLMYETSIGGVVELDRMLMQSRQDGEWKNFGPIPDRIRHIKWPTASPITCAFCEATGHLFDMCAHREAEHDIPRLAPQASNGPSEDGKDPICGAWNDFRGCFSKNCPRRHVCLLCQLPSHSVRSCSRLTSRDNTGEALPSPKPHDPISTKEILELTSLLASLQESEAAEDEAEVAAETVANHGAGVEDEAEATVADAAKQPRLERSNSKEDS